VSVWRTTETPVLLLRNVTVAPVITASEVSRITPWILPRYSWAFRTAAASVISTRAVNRSRFGRVVAGNELREPLPEDDRLKAVLMPEL
jgi:hypothetical protein